MTFSPTQFGNNIVADRSTQNPAYYDTSSGTPVRVALGGDGKYIPWQDAINEGHNPIYANVDSEGGGTHSPWEMALATQGTNPSSDWGFEKYVVPAMASFIGMGAAGFGPLGGAGGSAGGVGGDINTPSWALPTAGGVSDTGFGAGTVPQGGTMGEWDWLDNYDFGGAGEAGQASTPGVGDAGAFDQFGSMSGPGSNSTIFGGTADNPFGTGGLPDWLKNPSNINSVLKALGIPGLAPTGGATGGPQVPGQYQFPYGDILNAGLGYLSNRQGQATQERLMDKAINSDLFRTEQPKYFEPAYQAATQGIGNTPYGQSIADASTRKMASMGYNMSGNQISQLGQDLNRGTVDYMNAIGPYARGNGGVGSTIASMTPGIMQSQVGQNNSLGYGLGSILGGQQPTSNQQRTGTPPNQNLLQYFGL